MYAGVQQSLVSTLQGDGLSFHDTVPVLYVQQQLPASIMCNSLSMYNTEDGRNWKHEYEMLSLVLARRVNIASTHCMFATSHIICLAPLFFCNNQHPPPSPASSL